MALARGKRWPDTDPDAMLPTSAWREHRSRLAGHIDEDTFNRLVMVYSILEIDRASFNTAGAGSVQMSDSVVETMKSNASAIGELRRSMGARGEWPDYPEDFDKAGSA